MSTWKTHRDGASQQAHKKQPPHDADVQELPVPKVEVVNLEIVLDDETGYDPYNCTGEHCLEEIRKQQD